MLVAYIITGLKPYLHKERIYAAGNIWFKMKLKYSARNFERKEEINDIEN